MSGLRPIFPGPEPVQNRGCKPLDGINEIVKYYINKKLIYNSLKIRNTSNFIITGAT